MKLKQKLAVKENEKLIDSLAVEMARQHINDTFDIRKYYARDIPYEVVYPAYELSFKLKKDYIAKGLLFTQQQFLDVKKFQ